MKTTFLKQLLYVFVIVFSLSACNEEPNLIENSKNQKESYLLKKTEANEIDTKLAEYIKEYSGRDAKATFIGRIINEDNVPIEGAKVVLGTQKLETDKNGIVLFKSAQVKQHFSYIRASAEGYLNGSRVIVPDLGKENQNSFTIRLFKFKEIGSIDSEKGGEVSFRSKKGKGKGKGTVYFNPGFTDESDNIYEGTVAVSINYLDPLNPDTANKMPGDLYGITQDFEQVALGSYGMLQVELRGESGEKLEIIEPAKLIMPIHPDQIATAQKEVPMWSFNEYAGVWYEETMAYKEGEHYVTEVPHFSFWNCDAPFPVDDFCAIFIDPLTGNPIVGLRIEISYGQPPFKRFAITDVNGKVSGKVPSNLLKTIKIFDNCGNLLDTSQFTAASPSGCHIIQLQVTPPSQIFTLSGTVQNCSNVAINNGYISISHSPSGIHFMNISVNSAGMYSYTGVNCSLPDVFSITGVDLSTAEAETVTKTIYSGTNTQNITICGNALPSEYIRYKINSSPFYHYDLLNPSGGIKANKVFVRASSSTGHTAIEGENTMTIGNYPFGNGPNTMFMESLSHIHGINISGTAALPSLGRLSFNITAIDPAPGATGTYISISFAGNYKNNNNSISYSIEGDARIYRDY